MKKKQPIQHTEGWKIAKKWLNESTGAETLAQYIDRHAAAEYQRGYAACHNHALCQTVSSVFGTLNLPPTWGTIRDVKKPAPKKKGKS